MQTCTLGWLRMKRVEGCGPCRCVFNDTDEVKSKRVIPSESLVCTVGSKSDSFPAGVGWQGCSLLPFLFITFMGRIFWGCGGEGLSWIRLGLHFCCLQMMWCYWCYWAETSSTHRSGLQTRVKQLGQGFTPPWARVFSWKRADCLLQVSYCLKWSSLSKSLTHMRAQNGARDW